MGPVTGVDVGLKDKLKHYAEEAAAYAQSEETQERLEHAKEVTHEQLAKTKEKAQELADSEGGQKLIAKGREIWDEVLGLLADGDTPAQAAAKTAKAQLHSKDEPPEDSGKSG